jgi:CRP/FNR family cyclic AMP-dependent transcriptional regulator
MKHFDWTDFLAQHPLFSSLTEPELTILLRPDASTEKEYQEGQVILQEGEPGDTVFLIGAGSVQVVLPRAGRQETPLAILRQGDFFGEMAVLEHRERTATVRAREHCIILEIKGKEVIDILYNHPDIEFKFLSTLSYRLRHLNQVLAVKLQDVDEKMELFHAQMNAEMKAVEATLKATQTVFDQTKMRTDEVITSAERNWSRLTMIASAVGIVMSVLGWFGVKEFLDIKKYIVTTIEEVDDAKKQVERLLHSTQETADRARQHVESLDKLQKDAALQSQLSKDLNQQQERLQELADKLTLHVLYPALQDEIIEKNPARALELYDDFRSMQKLDELVLTKLLALIEPGILKEPEDSPAGYRAAYSQLLMKILGDLSVPKNKVKSYYLLLANAILDDQKDFGTEQTFESVRDDFEKYVRQYKWIRVERKELKELEAAFRAETPPRQALFDTIKRIIPTR